MVLDRAKPDGMSQKGQVFPLFFDQMTTNASKNYIVSQTRFNLNQKKLHDNNTRSCTDIARKKYEDQLRQGHDYNKKILREHDKKVRNDAEVIQGEIKHKKDMRKTLGKDLLVQI